MNRNKEACTCKNVTYGMLEDCVRQGITAYEAAQRHLRFGTGCGRCRDFIAHLLQELSEEYAAEQKAAAQQTEMPSENH